MSKSRWARIALPSVLAVLAVSIVPAFAGWAGKEVEKDGVTHVMNPATPESKPETVTLKEQWRIGGYDDDQIFGVITAIVGDDAGNFYMLDSQLSEIKVYSGSGEYLRTIGREGEGPGEFRRAFNIFVMPDGNIGVLQAFPPKIVVLTPQGDPAGEYPLPEIEDEGFRVIFSARNAGDKLAMVWALNQPGETGFTQKSILSLIADGGKREIRLHSQDSSMKAAEPKIAETEWDSFRNRWTASADGRAFSAVDFGQYQITVWGPEGKIDRIIQREYPAHVRTDTEKEWLLGIYKKFTSNIPIPGIKYEIEDNWNQIQGLQARDDGTLWVRTSRGTYDLPEGAIGTWDVFDEHGRFVRQVTLKGQGDPKADNVQFVKDRLFVVTDFLDAMAALQGATAGAEEEAEEEAAPMEIISYSLK